jgi:hypothetical protein
MDDRSITRPRWIVVRLSQSSRHQWQLLAQAYQQVFPQVRRSLSNRGAAASNTSGACPLTAARMAKGA